jgi:flagellar hook assembly protein FlgD
MKNSIYIINTKTNSSISVNPNPFSPDNDGFEDCTIINYSLKIPYSQVNIKIYDSRGRLVRVLANNMASGSTGSVIFDGLGNDGSALRMGIYIIFLEALNSITGQNEILKTTVVVARKLN